MCSKKPVSLKIATSTIIENIRMIVSQSIHVIMSPIEGRSCNAAKIPIDANVVKIAATVRCTIWNHVIIGIILWLHIYLWVDVRVRHWVSRKNKSTTKTHVNSDSETETNHTRAHKSLPTNQRVREYRNGVQGKQSPLHRAGHWRKSRWWPPQAHQSPERLHSDWQAGAMKSVDCPSFRRRTS